MEKRYYWLKLKDDFFSDKRIKKLRRIAGGDTYTIIYLKMMLRCINTDGVIEYEGIEDSLAEELALDLDEEADNVEVTVQFLLNAGLLIDIGENRYAMPTVTENTGSDNASTKRVQAYRQRQKAYVPKIEAKTNAERQNAYRAKKLCQDNGHVPFIEDYVNKKRYGGNYYICFKRDKCRCAICGDNNELCMHHIDGYDEKKPQNNDANKMITLCRKCHSNVHAGEPIPTEILESIGYYDFCNESNKNCNGNETQMKRNGNVEKEIEKDKEKDNINTYVNQVIDEYNSICKSLPKAEKITDKRKRLIKARLRDKYTLEDFKTVFKKAQASAFLRGETGRESFKPGIDWLLNEANMVKVLEGNYDDKPGGGGHGQYGTSRSPTAEEQQRREQALQWAEARANAALLAELGQLPDYDDM